MPFSGIQRCTPYASEEAKQADLATSYLRQLAGASVESARPQAAAPDARENERLRAWQGSQAWAPQRPQWRERLTPVQQAKAAANADMQRMLRRFDHL
jgi:hypothetical protein